MIAGFFALALSELDRSLVLILPTKKRVFTLFVFHFIKRYCFVFAFVILLLTQPIYFS